MADKVIDGSLKVTSLVKSDDSLILTNNIATKNGYYPLMSVGTADVAKNLQPYGENSGVRQTHPFVFQSTASGADVGSLCQFDSLLGQTYKIVQLVSLGDQDITTNGIRKVKSTGGTITFSGTSDSNDVFQIGMIASTESKPLDATHLYLIKWNFKGTVPDWSLVYSNQILLVGWNRHFDTDYIGYGRTASTYLQMSVQPTATVDFSIQPQIFDLTVMFGAGNEPTSVVEFNRLFPLPYYAYNAGQLVSSQSSKLITVGYNQFDEVYRQGSTQSGNTNTKVISSTNAIRVVAGQSYTFEAFDFSNVNPSGFYVKQYASLSDVENDNYTISTNFSDTVRQIDLLPTTQYVKIQINFSVDTTPTSSNVGKIAFHLTWDKSREGYEGYEVYEYILPNTVLRSAGDAYDEIKSSGEHITRIEYVDIKTLINGQYRLIDTSNNSGKQLIFDVGYGYLENHPAKAVGPMLMGNILATLYETVPSNTQYQQTHSSRTLDNIISISNTGYIAILSHAFDSLSTKQDLLDYFTAHPCYIQYELAEPTTEQVASFNENPFIDDFGTMEFNSIYPQGANFFYYADYKAFIDSLGGRQDIGYDASEIVSHTELEEVIVNAIEDCVKEDVVAPAYDSTATYALGAKVIYDGKLYTCSTAITQAEDFNSSHWTEITVSSGYVDLDNDQTISSIKTFDNYQYFNSGIFGKDASGYASKLDLNTSKNTSALIKLGRTGAPNSYAQIYLETTAVDKMNLNYVDKIRKSGTGYSLTLPDATNWTADKEIATTDQAFNVINASDISSNTLTQEQYDLVTNGKPTIIVGDFLTKHNMLLLTSNNDGSGNIFGFYLGQSSSTGSRVDFGQYKIVISTKVISLVGNPQQINYTGKIDLQLGQVNGKNVPAYPSSTGTFVLKCVDGVLTWVAE